jgi:hypothetical protein
MREPSLSARARKSDLIDARVTYLHSCSSRQTRARLGIWRLTGAGTTRTTTGTTTGMMGIMPRWTTVSGGMDWNVRCCSPCCHATRVPTAPATSRCRELHRLTHTDWSGDHPGSRSTKRSRSPSLGSAPVRHLSRHLSQPRQQDERSLHVRVIIASLYVVYVCGRGRAPPWSRSMTTSRTTWWSRRIGLCGYVDESTRLFAPCTSEECAEPTPVLEMTPEPTQAERYCASCTVPTGGRTSQPLDSSSRRWVPSCASICCVCVEVC